MRLPWSKKTAGREPQNDEVTENNIIERKMGLGKVGTYVYRISLPNLP